MIKIQQTVTTLLILGFVLGPSQGYSQSADIGKVVVSGQTETIKHEAGYPVQERRILGQLKSVLVIHERGPDQVIEDRSGDGSFLDPERDLEPLSTIPRWKSFEWN